MKTFWAQNIAARGGSLQVLDGDLSTVFAKLATGTLATPSIPSLEDTEKLEMLRFFPDQGLEDIYTAALQSAPLPEGRVSGPVRIGIRWECTTCDLDLFVRPHARAQVIFYGNASTADGHLEKDFQVSPNLTNGYETVTLPEGADLGALNLAVNFYRGQVKEPVTGELRLAVGGDVWAMPFTIAALQGNKGEGADAVLTRGETPHRAWTLLDVTRDMVHQ